MDILSSVKSQLSGKAGEMIAERSGLDANSVGSIVDATLPAMLGGLIRNAQGSDDDAQKLDQALAKHDGSLLDHLEADLEDDEKEAELERDGEKILGKVFKGNEGEMVDMVKEKAGDIDPQVAKKVMAIVAPIILANLGKAKKDQGLDVGGLTDMLATQGKGSGILDNPIAKMILDRDGDGKVGIGDAIKGVRDMMS